jgi:kelch-like protein 20
MFAGAGGGTTVDIYDARTGRWSTARLTVGLPAKAAATVGTKAMFIGGGNGFEHSDVVDIYYDATGRWSTARLSQVRQAPTATTVGSKVIIAGGLPQGTGADVYDDATGVWSTVQLSHRQPSVSTTVGHMAFFAGGYDVHGNPTEVVDVYNGRNGRWSTTTLPRPAFFDRAISVGSLAIFAGGLVPGADGNHVATDVVDIFDAATGAWSTAKLSLARFSFAAAAAGDKVLFAGGSYDLSDGIYDATDVVDVYDARTGEWSTTRLAAPRAQMGGTTVGGTAMFGAGYDPIDDEASGQQTVSALVDLFSYDDTPPSATLGAAGVTRRKSRQAYAFSVAYQDAYKVDAGTPDDGDIVVSGPGGFSAAARVVAQASGKHASTRVVTYAVSGPGDRWDASDNGTYTIHLQDDQVKDATGNAAVGRRLGAFTVDIPTASATPAPATVFEVARTIDRLTYSPSAAVRSANAGLFDDSPAGPLARVIE